MTENVRLRYQPHTSESTPEKPRGSTLSGRRGQIAGRTEVLRKARPRRSRRADGFRCIVAGLSHGHPAAAPGGSGHGAGSYRMNRRTHAYKNPGDVSLNAEECIGDVECRGYLADERRLPGQIQVSLLSTRTCASPWRSIRTNAATRSASNSRPASTTRSLARQPARPRRRRPVEHRRPARDGRS
jgi:hypothetical protein